MGLKISSRISQLDVVLIGTTKTLQVLAGPFSSWFCFSLLWLKPPPQGSAQPILSPQKAEVTETQRTTLNLQWAGVKGLLGFETAEEAHLRSGVTLRAGSQGLLHSGFGDPGGWAHWAWQGSLREGADQNLEAVGKTVLLFDKVLSCYLINLLSVHLCQEPHEVLAKCQPSGPGGPWCRYEWCRQGV